MKVAIKMVLVCIVALGAAKARAADRYTTAGTTSEVTVIDNVTELEWTKNNFGSLDWSGAKAKCATLTYGGKTGWRLPGVAELQTLVDYRGVGASRISSVFGTTAGEVYWTATPFALNPGTAWNLDFSDGSTVFGDEDDSGQVRCVR